MRIKTRIWTGLALCAALGGGAALRAQDAACTGGRMVGELGIKGLVGAARTHTPDWESRFRTEPMVAGVVRGGAAEGVLEARDVLVAIDGLLITTDEGGHRLANLRPAERVTLRIRRDGELRDVVITPSARCEQRPTGPLSPRPAPAPRMAPQPQPRIAADGALETGAFSSSSAASASAAPAPRPRPAPRKPTVPPPPAPQGPTIRFGFRLHCQECGALKTDAKGWAYWSFPEPPALDQVEPGSPADRAGLRPGDRLTQIDGIPLTSPEGGRRLAEAEAGDSVEITYLRGTEKRTARLVAVGIARNNNPYARSAVAPRSQPSQLRFSGSVGETEVEVRGAPVNVTEDRQNGEILIRSQDLLVRIKAPSKSGKKD
jgi:hypothetical protein